MERMISFLWISSFLASFPDHHWLLSTFQALMLMKLHTLALSLLLERLSFGKEKTHLFFTDDGEKNKRQIIYFITHFTAHHFTAHHYFNAQVFKFFLIFWNKHTQSWSAPALKGTILLIGPQSDSKGWHSQFSF